MPDILLSAAQSYQQLMDYTYAITIKTNTDIITLNIDFDAENFKHLTGVEKLKDPFVDSMHMSSSNFMKSVLNNSISYSSLSQSPNINTPINNPSQNGVKYYISDRLTALADLQNLFCNANPQNLKVHKWLRNAPKNLRPHQSDISADYLLSFNSAPCNKSPTEQVHSFFIEAASKGHFSGVSIFPCDKPYCDDGKIRVDEYQLLSVTEICKSTHSKTVIFEVTPDELAKAEKQVELAKANAMISNDIKSLKSKRNKVIENPSVGNQNKYDKQLAIFKNRNIYTADMVKEVINRLNDQLSAAPNDKVADMIKSEIKYLQDELIDRQQNPPQQLKGISISTVQMNDDSTLSVNNIATLPVPKAVTEVPKLVQRKTHTLTGTIKSFLSDVSDSIRKALAPKSHSEARRASQSKSKGNSPKKKQAAKKAVSVAPAKCSEQKQEQRSSVLGDITSARKELEKQRREAPTKDNHIKKKNNIEI